jgi:hypothetical protein
MPRKSSSRSAEEFFSEKNSLAAFRTAAADCKAVIFGSGTQTIFGEGRRRAVALFVGEQPVMTKILPENPLLGRLDACLIPPSRKRLLIVRKPMSPMWSSISNGNLAASDAFTKNQTPGKFQLAGRGWKPR